jgi:GDP-L-fucose synthase
MERQARVYVAGTQTLAGSAIWRALEERGYQCLLGGRGDDPDPADRHEVETFFARAKPEFVFVAAGKSGGIAANEAYPADFMLHNLLVECYILQSAWRHGVTKLLYLGSSCTYPRDCPQPMREEFLWTGPLEPSSMPYAVAKISGMTLCRAYRRQYGVNFISAIPADAFGPGDDFDPHTAHVVPGLIRRLHEARERGAKTVDVWGSGRPRRELLFADDLADACLFIMREYNGAGPLNIGGGTELSIRDLASLVKEIVGYAGELRFDTTKPDGMPRKLLDSSRLAAMGWRPGTPIRSALSKTYEWFRATHASGRAANA